MLLTVTCSNYASQAAHLSATWRRSGMVGARVVVLMDPQRPAETLLRRHFDEVVPAREVLGEGFISLVFSYDALEASCAMKALALEWALRRYDSTDRIVLMDPDCWIFSRMEELDELLSTRHVVLTPHLTLDEADPEVIGNGLYSVLRVGTFNLGFVGIRRTAQSLDLVRWWAARVLHDCRSDPTKGLFLDQRWMDLAVVSGAIEVLPNKGYNVNGANILARSISRRDSVYSIDGKPLRFIHFCGFGRTDDPDLLFRGVPMENKIHVLLARYRRRLTSLGHKDMRLLRWPHDVFASGERISRQSRRRYQAASKADPISSDPFALSNEQLETAEE